MKKMSLQWRLTCIITLYIAVICGCVTMLVYKNGVYYMDSLQEAVDTRGDDQPDDAEEIYISIPEDKWDEFANDFSVQVYNNKADYRKNRLDHFSSIGSSGWSGYLFYKWACTQTDQRAF